MTYPTIDMQLRLPLPVASYVNQIADKAGIDGGAVIAVLLAQYVLRNPLPPSAPRKAKK